MAAGRDRPIANALMQDAHQLESSYREWQTRRPQLSHRRDTIVPMAPQTKVCIIVLADVIVNGQEHPVKLCNALYGSVATRSLISKNKAVASRGAVRSTPVTMVTDHAGRTYSSSSTISLRWYYEDETRSYSETFHIVESTSEELPWHAILRSGVDCPFRPLTPEIHALYPAPPKHNDSQRKRDGEKRRELDVKKYEKDREEQAKKIREAVALKHAITKHG